MSYLLGWKTRSNVYLAAESMLTGSVSSIDTQSSFGERHICEGSKSVAERALKIIVDEDLAIGLCGDFRVARDLASSVTHCYRRSRDLEAALQEMVVSNSPFSTGCDAQLIVAWRGQPCPRLFSFNHDGRATIREAGNGEGFQFGSASSIHKSMTWDLLEPLIPLEDQGPAVHLAAALGLLQSYGIHEYLLPNGVGGSFTGLSVTRGAIAWQPDLLYLIDEPGKDIWSGVATCVRDHNLIVSSSITNATRVFVTTSETNETGLAQWSSRWERFAQSYLGDKLFDFVVLLGITRWVVIVIEMRRNAESRRLRFYPDSAIKDGICWFELHTDMIPALRREFSNSEPDARDFRFGFEPYEAPARPRADGDTPRNRGVGQGGT